MGTPIPRGVAEDAAGNIYVAEFNSRKIFVFSAMTRKIMGVIGPQSDENDVRGIDIDPVEPRDLHRRCLLEPALRVLV